MLQRNWERPTASSFRLRSRHYLDEIQTTETHYFSSFFAQLCPLVVMCTMHSAVRTGSYINRWGASLLIQSSKHIPAERSPHARMRTVRMCKLLFRRSNGNIARVDVKTWINETKASYQREGTETGVLSNNYYYYERLCSALSRLGRFSVSWSCTQSVTASVV
jgi:hypothetical protein